MIQRNEVNDTTRRFARSLDEAFPQSADYGYAITRHKRVGGGWTILAGLLVVGVLLLVLYNIWRLT